MIYLQAILRLMKIRSIKFLEENDFLLNPHCSLLQDLHDHLRVRVQAHDAPQPRAPLRQESAVRRMRQSLHQQVAAGKAHAEAPGTQFNTL